MKESLWPCYHMRRSSSTGPHVFVLLIYAINFDPRYSKKRAFRSLQFFSKLSTRLKRHTAGRCLIARSRTGNPGERLDLSQAQLVGQRGTEGQRQSTLCTEPARCGRFAYAGRSHRPSNCIMPSKNVKLHRLRRYVPRIYTSSTFE
jgi:hypothetical protein